MLESIFGMLNYSALLVFGVFVSAAFLDIPFNKKNIAALSLFIICGFALQIISYVAIGYNATTWLYPVITHIPLVLFFVFCYKRPLLSGIYAVISAYLCCQLSKWMGILVLELTGMQWVAFSFRTVTTIVLGFLIIRFLASSVAVILTKPLKTVLVFTIIPAVYYLFDYIATVYTDLLYSGSEAVFEFLPFVLCVAYLIFNVAYFKVYEDKCEAERHNQLMEMQRLQSEKELEAIKRSEYAVSLLRHDMRHFLNNISAFIESGDPGKAKAYIGGIITAADNTAMFRYCNNEIINMILSSYENETKQKGIRLLHTIQIPDKLPFSDVDLTSILSNGLENAFHAVSTVEPDKRVVTLDLHMNDSKLLLSIKNPYAHKIEMVDGIPQVKEIGHGIGTHSIRYVTEKLKGNCQFTVKDNLFILRVVL